MATLCGGRSPRWEIRGEETAIGTMTVSAMRDTKQSDTITKGAD